MSVWRCSRCGEEVSVGIRVLSARCPKGHAMQPVAKEPVPTTKGKP